MFGKKRRDCERERDALRAQLENGGLVIEVEIGPARPQDEIEVEITDGKRRRRYTVPQAETIEIKPSPDPNAE